MTLVPLPTFQCQCAIFAVLPPSVHRRTREPECEWPQQRRPRAAQRRHTRVRRRTRPRDGDDRPVAARVRQWRGVAAVPPVVVVVAGHWAVSRRSIAARNGNRPRPSESSTVATGASSAQSRESRCQGDDEASFECRWPKRRRKSEGAAAPGCRPSADCDDVAQRFGRAHIGALLLLLLSPSLLLSPVDARVGVA